ncbi:MAG TPA: thioredoxin family protein [Chloroflexota bacterium]|nr:thioredoxin family protein [Chloroflexota bacterium]
MTGRQIVNRNSYVLMAGLVLIVAAYFVAQLGSLGTWLAWIVVVLLLYVGFLRLRPGRGTAIDVDQLEQVVGGGTPVLLELYSNYCVVCMAAKPMVDGMEKELGRHVRFVKVDVGTLPGKKIAAYVGLDLVPTFIGYDREGTERWRSARLPPRAELWRRVAAL